jgi:hypothetical protein
MTEKIEVENQGTLEKPLKLGFKHVFSNYMFLSDFSFMVVNQPSYSMAETDLKYRVYTRTKTFAYFGGGFGCITYFGLCARYFMRSKNFLLKMALGGVYVLTIQNSLTLGTHLGIFLSLKKSMNILLSIDSDSPSSTITQIYAKRILENDESVDMNDVYNTLYNVGKDPLTVLENQFIMNETYVQNDFFIKNKNKFMLSNNQSKTDRQSHHVFEEEMYQKSPLKYDCFLTRYLYIRWLKLTKKHL